jgi:trehalose 6-phosphate phosphatase
MFRSQVSVPVVDAALFLDLDGTVAAMAAHPRDVGPDLQRNALLANLVRQLDGRIAIVSGRSVGDVDRITGNTVACVAGVHGLERRDAQRRLSSVEPHPELDRACREAEAFVRSRPGLHLESKRLGVALHYRQEPQMGGDVLDFARRLAWSTGLKLQEGRTVVELRSPGPDKGDTVQAFMREEPFRGATPIFVGDDATDEDGFATAQALGGLGVLVGHGQETRAIAGLEDVASVHVWIGNALASGYFDLDLF